MSVHKKGGAKTLSPRERCAARQREYDRLPSDKKDGRKRPGSVSGRK